METNADTPITMGQMADFSQTCANSVGILVALAVMEFAPDRRDAFLERVQDTLTNALVGTDEEVFFEIAITGIKNAFEDQRINSYGPLKLRI